MDTLRILTISGWSQPADSLLRIAPGADAVDYIDYNSPEALIEALPNQEYDVIIGWSLGGILARQLLRQRALVAQALVSLSAPVQFVSNHQMRQAMPPETFQQFYANYRDDTQRTVKRFHGLLAKNDSREKEVLRELSHHPRVTDTASWLKWMDFLHSHSAYEHDYSRLPPTLIIHGDGDAVVPVAQAQQLQEMIPDSQLHLMAGCGHAPHYHDVKQVQSRIDTFMRTLHPEAA